MILRRRSTVTPVRIAEANEVQQAQQTTLVGFGNDDILSVRAVSVQSDR